jgi:hypothetical protein
MPTSNFNFIGIYFDKRLQVILAFIFLFNIFLKTTLTSYFGLHLAIGYPG